MAKLVAFDFESEGIESFPDYPPKPTMLGIYEAGKKPVYYSWGHPILRYLHQFPWFHKAKRVPGLRAVKNIIKNILDMA